MKHLITLCLIMGSYGFSQAQAKSKAAPSANQVYSVAEKMPTFPGGIEAFQKYIAKTLRYPESAMLKKQQGKVYVSMIVEKDGLVKDVKVARGTASPELNKEAMRVVASSPKWNPGMQNGKPVRVYYLVPVEVTLI